MRAAVIALVSIAASAANAQWSAVPLHAEELFRSEVRAIIPTNQFGYSGFQSQIRATRWSGAASSWEIYNPGSQLTSGFINAAWGTLQAGSLNGRATLWSGPGTQPQNLHPNQYQSSEILAMDGGSQVGRATVGSTLFENAAMWSGTPESVINLHPADAQRSWATGVVGGQQCGYGWYPASGYRALLWNGSAASMTLLHPTGAAESQAFGMVAGQQVGYSRGAGQNPRAALWTGSAASYRDLHPPGAGVSELRATCGSAQVGYASTADGFVAGIWFGSAESFVSLGSLLPPGFDTSVATCVAEANGVFYVGGYATEVNTGSQRAWMWVGVPAPGTASLLIGAGLIAARRRRH